MPDALSFITVWDVDGGALVRHYAAKPYGHYKEEVYPIFAEILSGLGDAPRVLDIGAGPGHMAYEFYAAYPRSQAHFTLLEMGGGMLSYADERLKAHAPTLVQRSFNDPAWNEGLGGFDAIVSNNAIFNLKPELLPEFYSSCFSLLKQNGILLNQQSCGYETAGFKDAARQLPEAIAMEKLFTPAEHAMYQEKAREKDALWARSKALVKELQARGTQVVAGETGYASLHVPASEHVRLLGQAGFTADCIWRKMEFVILAGLKGRPFEHS